MDDDEITEEISGISPRLMDFIPIYISEVDDEQMIVHEPHRERRFLDFLRAQPSRDWFAGKLSPLTFLQRKRTDRESASPALPTLPQAAPGDCRPRRRFRVPFARKIDWPALLRYCEEWIKHPMNMAMVVWLLAVGACLLVLLLVMSGLLDREIPQSKQRKKWQEVINQIMNALFTIMCVYQHPRLFHHFVILCRWGPKDISELRKVYCRSGSTGRRRERAHIAFVIVLLHVTCFAQYALCGLYWGYSIADRPEVGENLCIGVGIAVPVVAFVYMFYGPLGRKLPTAADYQDSQREERTPSANVDALTDIDMKLHRMRLVVRRPEWVGGLFDCRDDGTVCCLSFCCTFCVFGWNAERLGFGNMYVHIATFLLLCVAPFWVFNIAGLNIHDDAVRGAVGVVGVVLCFFGLLYGGFWRTKMRKRFKLPSSRFCCGLAAVTDYAQWLFCWACSLAQEVRTGNFYDIEEGSFYSKQSRDGRLHPVLAALPREGGGSARFVKLGIVDFPQRCRSCPANIWAPGSPCSTDGLLASLEEERSSSMVAPVPFVIEVKSSQS